VSTLEKRVGDAVKRIRAANQQYFELEFDEDSPQELGEPAAAQELHALQARTGKPLSASYKAFLEQHNGWRNISGKAMLLPTTEHDQPWVAKRIKRVREHFSEFFDASLLDHAFFVMLGAEEKDFAFLDLATVREDGECDVVYADLDEGEVDRFPDFAAFLEDMADTAEELVREAS
jgi:hypothetical protein